MFQTGVVKYLIEDLVGLTTARVDGCMGTGKEDQPWKAKPKDKI